MRHYPLILLGLLWMAGKPALAVTIDPSASAGSVPTAAGTGLNGAYYKFPTSSVTSMSMASLLIAAAGTPTATFTTQAVCYPSCNGGSIADSNSLTTLLGGNVNNFAYTVPSWQIPTSLDHSAMVISGYIAIAQAGAYTFNLGSDDGSLLTIGGQTVVDNSSMHAFTVASGTAVFAQAGLYAITVQYFENSGNTGLELWGADSFGNCIIGRDGNCMGTAASNLFYTSAATGSAAVAEPAPAVAFAIGLVALDFVRRRKRRAI